MANSITSTARPKKKKKNQAQGQQINLESGHFGTKNEIQIFNNVNYVSAHYKSQISPVLLLLLLLGHTKFAHNNAAVSYLFNLCVR